MRLNVRHHVQKCKGCPYFWGCSLAIILLQSQYKKQFWNMLMKKREIYII